MRRRLLPTMFCLTLLLPAFAHAQQEIRFADGQGLTAPETKTVEHEVATGDTLWDLCDGYYANPWLWPSIWARNPHVSNPHYIYPGDILFFPPLKEEVAEQKEQGSKTTPGEPSVGGARVRFVPKDWGHQVFVRYVGFVTDSEVRSAGRIRHSREEREMLSELDEVYIDFERLPRVRPGDRWTILALGKEIHHPIYKRKVGTKVDILGVVDIRSVSRKVAMGVIVRSYKEIRRGALVTPLVPNFRSVRPRPNEEYVRGYVVDSFLGLENLGQHQFVYVDKGVRENVKVGNRFHVVRRGDGLETLASEALEKLPWEPIGEVMIVETRDHHSTGIVLGNFQEINVGDVVEMRKGF